MRLGKYSVIQDERLDLRHEIIVEGEVILAGCDLKSEVDPPVLMAPDCRLRITSCRLEGTFVSWFQEHNLKLEWQEGDWLGAPVNAPGPIRMPLPIGAHNKGGASAKWPSQQVLRMAKTRVDEITIPVNALLDLFEASDAMQRAARGGPMLVDPAAAREALALLKGATERARNLFTYAHKGKST